MKVTYKISYDMVRNVCVENDFYNAGTNAEYEKMFSKVSANNGVKTAEEIFEIAEDIYFHTSKYDNLSTELVAACLLQAAYVLSVER